MQTTTTTSKKGTLNLNDFWKGFLVAVITPVFTIIMTSLNAGSLVFNWIAIGTTALAAILAYLTKNLFSSSKIVVSNATPETVAAVKEGTEIVKVGNVVAPTNK